MLKTPRWSNVPLRCYIPVWSCRQRTGYKVFCVLVNPSEVVLGSRTISSFWFPSMCQSEVCVGCRRITETSIQYNILCRFARVILLKANTSMVWVQCFVIASWGDEYLIFAFLSFIVSKSSLIQANLSVFQQSALVALSPNLIKQLINLNLFSEIIAANTSWEISWF